MRSWPARRWPACGGSAPAAATAGSPWSGWPSASPSWTTPRPGSFVVLSRLASAEVTDYRLDMALRWAAIRRVAAVAAFSAEAWQPAVTALDIAEHADIALVSLPADADLAALVQAVFGEIGGGAERALARAEQGLEAVRRAERAGAGPEELGQV